MNWKLKLQQLLCRHDWQRSMFVVLGEHEAAIWCPRCGKHKERYSNG